MAIEIRIRAIAAATLSALAILASKGSAADEGRTQDPERDQNVEIIRDYVSRHRLAVNSAPDELLEMRPEPLLYWTNPTRFRSFGGIYVWPLFDFLTPLTD